jgi:hypothetical protein
MVRQQGCHRFAVNGSDFIAVETDKKEWKECIGK